MKSSRAAVFDSGWCAGCRRGDGRRESPPERPAKLLLMGGGPAGGSHPSHPPGAGAQSPACQRPHPDPVPCPRCSRTSACPVGMQEEGKGLPRQPPALPGALELPPHVLCSAAPRGGGYFLPGKYFMAGELLPVPRDAPVLGMGWEQAKPCPGRPQPRSQPPALLPALPVRSSEVGLRGKLPDSAGSQTGPSSQHSRAARSWAGAKRLSRCCAAGGL